MPTIRDRFIAFHKMNPEVYQLFERFTLEAIDCGVDKMGARLIYERIRWENMITTKGAGYSTESKKLLKLNDNYIAWYARLFMAKNRKHVGIFELRNVVSK
jgi:hypothetical protein